MAHFRTVSNSYLSHRFMLGYSIIHPGSHTHEQEEHRHPQGHCFEL